MYDLESTWTDSSDFIFFVFSIVHHQKCPMTTSFIGYAIFSDIHFVLHVTESLVQAHVHSFRWKLMAQNVHIPCNNLFLFLHIIGEALFCSGGVALFACNIHIFKACYLDFFMRSWLYDWITATCDCRSFMSYERLPNPAFQFLMSCVSKSILTYRSRTLSLFITRDWVSPVGLR